MIHDSFRLNPDLKPLYSLEDTTSIQWMGDDKIFEFLEWWKQIVANNIVELTPKQLAVIFAKKMPTNSKAVGQDVAYWNRLP